MATLTPCRGTETHWPLIYDHECGLSAPTPWVEHEELCQPVISHDKQIRAQMCFSKI